MSTTLCSSLVWLIMKNKQFHILSDLAENFLLWGTGEMTELVKWLNKCVMI